MIVAGLASYETTNRYGLTVFAFADDAYPSNVEIQLTPTDLAFLASGMISKYGLGNVINMICRIAQDDPTGEHVGLSAPARILDGIDPRKAG